MPEEALAGAGVGVCVNKPFQLRIVVPALEIVEAGVGWTLLCAQERLSPSCALLFRTVPAEKANVTAQYQVPASIAFGHPNTDLSGIFLKPLRVWDYPNKLPFVPKRRCLLVPYLKSQSGFE